jgi:hypothetical protein
MKFQFPTIFELTLVVMPEYASREDKELDMAEVRSTMFEFETLFMSNRTSDRVSLYEAVKEIYPHMDNQQKAVLRRYLNNNAKFTGIEAWEGK